MKTLKIKEVIALLTKVEKEHGNLPCVASSDDEGNNYNQVIFAPTPMRFKGD